MPLIKDGSSGVKMWKVRGRTDEEERLYKLKITGLDPASEGPLEPEAAAILVDFVIGREDARKSKWTDFHGKVKEMTDLMAKIEKTGFFPPFPNSYWPLISEDPSPLIAAAAALKEKGMTKAEAESYRNLYKSLEDVSPIQAGIDFLQNYCSDISERLNVILTRRREPQGYETELAAVLRLERERQQAPQARVGNRGPMALGYPYFEDQQQQQQQGIQGRPYWQQPMDMSAEEMAQAEYEAAMDRAQEAARQQAAQDAHRYWEQQQAMYDRHGGVGGGSGRYGRRGALAAGSMSSGSSQGRHHRRSSSGPPWGFGGGW